MSNKKRYPGPKPFAANQSELFYGRKDEAQHLLQLMQEQQLTVLYGRSGYGKSSLLNAAVLPKMEEAGYQLVNVRMGAWTPKSTNTPIRSTVQAIADNPEHLERNILNELIQWDTSLWYYTKTYAINQGQTKLLFVFDQFEELFTYPAREIKNYENSLAELLKTSLPQRYRNQLKKKKGELADHPQRSSVFKRLEIKVVIGIRSNRFHLLERLSAALPSILQNTLELDALERDGARRAIVGPAEQEGEFVTPPFSYSESVQEQILDFLTQEGKIEGVLLQMLCSHFERLIQKNPEKDEITEADLLVSGSDGIAGLEDIVDHYYRERIDDLPDDQEETVKRFIEDNLVQKVGKSGMRLSMHQAQIKERFGIEADILNTLVGNGLLRTEPFLRGGVTYELTHDRLIAPVLKSKAVFDAGEADRLKKQLELEERKRKEAETLRVKAEKAKAEAEAERTRAQAAEEEALKARQQAVQERQQAIEARVAAERNEKRSRRLAWMSAALMLAVAFFAFTTIRSNRTARYEEARRALTLCKDLLVDARGLAGERYCISADEKLASALALIDLYGSQGDQNTCDQFEDERGRYQNVKKMVDQTKTEGQCN